MAILRQREKLYEDSKRKNPERWSGKTRDWTHDNIVRLNPVNETDADRKSEKENKRHKPLITVDGHRLLSLYREYIVTATLPL